MGVKLEDDLRSALRMYARTIQKFGFDAKSLDFKLQNIVAGCNVELLIHPEGFTYSHGRSEVMVQKLWARSLYTSARSVCNVLTSADSSYSTVWPTMRSNRKAYSSSSCPERSF